jgi:hypothetical protein
MSLVLVEGELDEPLGRTQRCCCQLSHPQFLMIQVEMLSPGTLLAVIRSQSALRVQVEPVLLALGGTQCA